MVNVELQKYISKIDRKPGLSDIEAEIYISTTQIVDSNNSEDSDLYYQQAKDFLNKLLKSITFDDKPLKHLKGEFRAEYLLKYLQATLKIREKKVQRDEYIRDVQSQRSDDEFKHIFKQTKLPSLNGDNVRVSDYFDQEGIDLVLFSFWGTWCHPCLLEVSYLNQLQNDYPNIKIVGINTNEGEGVIQKIEQLKVVPEYELLIDEHAEFAKQLNPYHAIPHIFVFKSDGTLLDEIVGFKPPEKGDKSNPILERIKNYLP